jgi:hypothetical protein
LPTNCRFCPRIKKTHSWQLLEHVLFFNCLLGCLAHELPHEPPGKHILQLLCSLYQEWCSLYIDPRITAWSDIEQTCANPNP